MKRPDLRLNSISSISSGPSASLSSNASPPLPLPTPPMQAVTPAPPAAADFFINPFEFEHVDLEPTDYFNCKPRTYFPLAAVGPPSSARTIAKPRLTSYFSPMITPAPTESLTRPSSPTLHSFIPTRLPPTPEEGPFPYMSFESTFKHTPFLFPLPPTTLPPRPPSPPPSASLVTIKVYFKEAEEFVKFRVESDISLRAFIRLVAARVGTGWESLYGAGEGTEVENVPSMDPEQLLRLNKDPQWESWLHHSLATQKRRVLWAM